MPARFRDPIAWSRLLQLLKTVAAAVIAWELALHVLDLRQPFLAPWAAVLTVHATVYRTFRRGAQQVGASVLGVLLAFAAGSLLGVNAASLGVVLFCGLLAGSVRGLRAESTTAAATALVVLLAGYSESGAMVTTRLADTGIGVAVGLLVNLLVWAPIGDRIAARHVDAIDDRIGQLLIDLAAGLRETAVDDDALEAWTDRTRDIDRDIEEGWGVVRQARESGRLNPRRKARGRIQATGDFEAILERVEQASAETRSMARTIRLAGVPPDRWDPRFRDPWVALLARTGAAVTDAHAQELRAVRVDLDALATELTDDELPDRFWPIAGALLVNLRNIVASLDLVADAQPVGVPAPALSRVHPSVRSRL